ncbi:uncharacterized protein LOC129583898 isoform X1 [Paramacrobiotus metropolitanus]|uniref:uncharacterized protein LOC129583898 isoform X1 n=1 Tax=Paramacrobiotus metropolitanus TaxID=2943436 RepID=UPI002445E045|nr:uncharacterized protein LOC129583898 isoform X1 [Paramacrobiotus metropolitanus]
MATKTGQEAYKLLEFQPQTVFLPNSNDPARRVESVDRREVHVNPEMPRAVYNRPEHTNGFREPEYAHVPPRDHWEHARHGPAYHENRGYDQPLPGKSATNPVYVLVPTNPGTAQMLEDSVYARCEPSKVMLDSTPSLHRKRIIERERYIDRDAKGCCTCWCWTIAFVVILAILAVGAAVTAIVVIKLNVNGAASGSRQSVAVAGTHRPDQDNRISFDVADTGDRRSLIIANTSGDPDSSLSDPLFFPNGTDTLVTNISDVISVPSIAKWEHLTTLQKLLIVLIRLYNPQATNITDLSYKKTGTEEIVTITFNFTFPNQAPAAAFDILPSDEQHVNVTDDRHFHAPDGHLSNGTALDISQNTTSPNTTAVEFDVLYRNADGSESNVKLMALVDPNTTTAVTEPAVGFTAAVLHPVDTPSHVFHHPIDPGMATTVLPLDRLAFVQSQHQAETAFNNAKNAKELANELVHNATELLHT